MKLDAHQDKIAAYGREFYEETVPGALRSARAIVPIVLAHLPVRSAVDIGCGHGAWLHALEECDVTDIIGYDGTYVDQSKLLMHPANFRVIDLRDAFEIDRTFELAISLEVAEHLPKRLAQQFIQRLVSAAPIVLFSAAIPGQIGHYHINVQWQDYWRSIFKTFGFHPVDLVRPHIWGHSDVEYWYQQNIILYCSDEALGANECLRPVPHDVSLNIVHPSLYCIQRPRRFEEEQQKHWEGQIERGSKSVFWYFSLLSKALRAKARRRLSRSA